MKSAIAALFAASLLPAAAGAKPPAEVVEAAVRMGATDDPPPHYKPVGRGMIRSISLTGGKTPDWLIDGEKSGMPVRNCGTGGCNIEIWSQQPDGHYALAYSHYTRWYKFRPIPGGKRTWMEVDFHGSACGLAGYQDCPWGFEWQDDGFGGRFLGPSLRFIKGEIVRAGGFPQALDPLTQGDRKRLPPGLKAIVARDQAACASKGLNLQQEGLAGRLPDINGDGVPDWAYDGGFSTCAFTETKMPEGDPCAVLTCETRLWVSRRTGSDITWVEVEKDPHQAYALRLTAKGVVGVYRFDMAACDVSTLDRCALTPLSLSPKP